MGILILRYHRYSLTATLVSTLLVGGIASPHQTLDGIVKELTGFEPTDGNEWSCREDPSSVNLEIIKAIKTPFKKTSESFSFVLFRSILVILSLSTDGSQKLLLARVLRDRISNEAYKMDELKGDQKDLLVQLGFARIICTLVRDYYENVPVVDEPITILAASKWLDRSTQDTVFTRFYHDVRKKSFWGNVFQEYLVFYLREAFRDGPRLDKVFYFRSDFARRRTRDLQWQEGRFTLVTISKTAYEANRSIWVVTPSSGPSSNLAVRAKSVEDVQNWILTNSERRTFCIPPTSMGPDILFFIQSISTKKTLLVALRVETQSPVTIKSLNYGVRKVTPSLFWKEKYERVSISLSNHISSFR
jgi:hypothetical protein